MKRYFLLIALCIFSFNAIHASISWTLSDDGTLTISGTGDMRYYNQLTDRPWNSKIENIKKIIIEEGITSIGGFAFKGCSGLTSVTIPNSVTSIGQSAFYGCSGLTSITIPKFVTSIGSSCFYGCSCLTSINIPESVNSIGEWAFYKCFSLASINIPESVTIIGNNTFYGCSSLSSVTIPNSITSIKDYAFQNCSDLTSVNIGNSVTSIGSFAFAGCSKLKFIIIPKSVISIGGCAFSNCSMLTSVKIPESVTYIGWSIFRGCSKLTSIEIPKSATTIGENAFNGCSSLTSITIPESVTSIGEYAFSNCTSLISLTCKAVIPPGCGTKCFNNVSKSIPLYVPTNSIKTYNESSQWKEFTNIQAIVTTVTLDFQGGKDGTAQVTALYKEAMPTGDDVIAPTRIGYTFDGYYDSLDDNGTKYYNADMTSTCNWDLDVAEITLYAKWIQNNTPTIVLSDEDATIWIGKTKKLTATLTPTTTSQTKFIWSSSDTNVATVSKYGTISAIGKGTCIITCEAADEYGTKAVCEVTVKQPIMSIDFGYEKLNLTAGTKKILTPKIYPSNADVQPFSWKSKNKSVATVTSEGVLTAVAPGTAQIICTATDGFKKADTITVEVVPLKITDSKPTIAEGTYGIGGIVYTRTLTEGKYAAFCLPYNVNLNDYTDEFAKVYVPMGMAFLKPNGTLMVMFKKVSLTETIKAGKPFVALAAKSGAVAITNDYKKTFTTLTNPEPASLDVYNWSGSNGFLDFNPDITAKIGGNYGKLTGLDSEKYYLVSTSGAMSKAASVSPYRIYVYKDDKNSNAKVTEIIFSFDEDEMATGIENITNEQKDDDKIYNINGQRINKANAQKGIYIKNGKKYANKN